VNETRTGIIVKTLWGVVLSGMLRGQTRATKNALQFPPSALLKVRLDFFSAPRVVTLLAVLVVLALRPRFVGITASGFLVGAFRVLGGGRVVVAGAETWTWTCACGCGCLPWGSAAFFRARVVVEGLVPGFLPGLAAAIALVGVAIDWGLARGTGLDGFTVDVVEAVGSDFPAGTGEELAAGAAEAGSSDALVGFGAGVGVLGLAASILLPILESGEELTPVFVRVVPVMAVAPRATGVTGVKTTLTCV
jgi:hypothetical protein